MSLWIQLLGQPRIRRDGVAVDLTGYRPVALLAYLIVTKKAHTRQQLIDLLFDGPDDPRAALRWTLSKIRKLIGEEYLLADREEVSFNFESECWVDVAEFEAGELELYQSDFLEGLYLRDALRFEDWLGFERGRLRGKYQEGLERQLERHRRQGESASVVISAMLVDIQTKLSLILNTLCQQGAGLSPAESKPVSLSAAGIRILTRDTFAIGQFVEVQMLLTVHAPVWIVVYGEVARFSTLDGGENEVAINFDEMDEEVRDMITTTHSNGNVRSSGGNGASESGAGRKRYERYWRYQWKTDQ